LSTGAGPRPWRRGRLRRRLLAALPPMGRLADEAAALAWLEELAAAH